MHVLWAWAFISVRFARIGEAEREAFVQGWARGLLRLWRIDLQVRGQPPAQGPLLLVANHLSWLDIVVLHAAGFCRFIAKSDIKRWPFIGTMATGAGTLYIEREAPRDALRVMHHMKDALLRGEVVAVFPEGAIGNGVTLLPFHGNLIQAAISASAPVQPVALCYADARTGQPSLAPVYGDGQTLAGSVWRLLTTPGTRAVVSYGRPQFPVGRQRRQWAAELHAAVAQLRDAAAL
ncbi:MAG: 1-acyl-sn-glycerol-3-phosphate acyltransferase [Burkholderiaceae bacterium]|nr:1-acyl-sn-glycerol-3-phosphate acyltransferase [Burkholderiaceae bacterium]